MSYGFARRRDDREVLMGDINGTLRVGLTDFVCVRDANPSGTTFAALLERRTTSSNPAELDDTLLDDAYLPALNTPMLAVRMNDGAGPIQWRIDVSSLVLIPATA